MKVLVFGANGFIGRAIYKSLTPHHTVVGASKRDGDIGVDLEDYISVLAAIQQVQPEIIVNAAGIVDPNLDASLNVTFTRNIINAIAELSLNLRRLITLGSAGEYGYVPQLPVKETFPLTATSPYGLAKIEEETLALRWGEEKGISVVVVRVFNPIGIGMAEKFFVSRVKRQLREYQQGERKHLTVSRKDSLRDYIAVEDIAAGIRCIIEGDPSFNVYNLGSGTPTSNGELLAIMMRYSNIEPLPPVVEENDTPEPLVAGQADTTRMTSDFAWRPTRSIEDVVKEIMRDE